MTELANSKCLPCEGKVPPLAPDRIAALLPQVPGWGVSPDGKKLEKRFTFADFRAAMAFLNRVAEIAEGEQHHPDFLLHGYRLVDMTLSTHAIGGLSENDFILAAKIGARVQGP